MRGPDADDLVAEAFAKVLNVLLKGGGPDLAFRAYLLAAVRRIHIDRLRHSARSQPTDDLDSLDTGVPFTDTAVAGFETSAAAKAFATLPERWQLVLWHLEVEGQKPAEVAPILGLSANSVSVLAYRAREGLRQAFLQMHAAEIEAESCTWVRGKLGGYVRQGLSKRDNDKVESHLEDCRPCMAVYLELTEVNSSLAAVLGPLVLGSAAAAYLGGGASGGTLAVISGALGRGRDYVLAHSQAALIAGAAATAATVGVVTTLVNLNDDTSTVQAASPRTVEGTPDETPWTLSEPATPKQRVEEAVTTPSTTVVVVPAPVPVPAAPSAPPASQAPAPKPAPPTTSKPTPPPPRSSRPRPWIRNRRSTPNLPLTLSPRSTPNLPLTRSPSRSPQTSPCNSPC